MFGGPTGFPEPSWFPLSARLARKTAGRSWLSPIHTWARAEASLGTRSPERLFPDQPYPFRHHVTPRSQPADAESECPPAAQQLRLRLDLWSGQEFPCQFLQGPGWNREKQKGEQRGDAGQGGALGQPRSWVSSGRWGAVAGGGWAGGGGAVT